MEIGRKLPWSAEAELQKVIEAHVQRAYQPAELPRWVAPLLALCAMGLGAWAKMLSTLRPTWLDGVVGAVIGFGAVMIPFGFALQWMLATDSARAVKEVRRRLSLRERECPVCDTKVMPSATGGPFDCVQCKASLITAPLGVVRDEPPRTPHWEALVQGAVDANPTRLRRSQIVLLVAIAAATLVTVYAVLSAR